MAPVVYFDCESDCTFRSVGVVGRDESFKRMQATVVCALAVDEELCTFGGTADHALASATAFHWWRDVAEPGKGPFDSLLKLFDEAVCIVAYNGLDFDFPLLRKHYGKGVKATKRYIEHRTKCHDPFSKLRAATDMWFKLDVLLAYNKLPAKIGNGLDAIAMWEKGEREPLRLYCLHDVQALLKLTFLPMLDVLNVGLLPNHVHGIASAVAGIRAVQAPVEDEEFVMICSGKPAELLGAEYGFQPCAPKVS